MGYLAQTGRADDADLRRAMIYGSVLGSFAVERFGLERLRDLQSEEIEERARAFRELVAFELGVGVDAGV
jgi:hypothetical protein